MRLEELVVELTGYSFEKEWFELKENWFEPKALGEYVSALSNSAAYVGREAGYFIWGISDAEHEIVGTSFDPDCDVSREPLQHYLARQLSPSIAFDFHVLDMRGKRVVVLEIAAARVAPTSFAGELFIRIGSSKENLRRYPEREARLFDVLSHGIPTIENTASEEQELTFQQLLAYYGSRGLVLTQSTFERNLGLRTPDGRYNIMAHLLSDDSGVPVRVAIFDGPTKAGRMHSVREFGHQCLLYTLDEVLRYADVLNVIQADEVDRVVERKDVPLFDLAVFREACINAFLHNAWISGDAPMVTAYSDRIEILSRGTLPPGQSMEGFFAGESVPVNRRLSEIFLQLRISERTGRGVPRITARYGRSVFEFRENSIVVTLPYARIGVGDTALQEGQSDRQGGGSRKVVKLDEAILAEMRDTPSVTKAELVQLLGSSKASVDRAIARLRKDGLLERVGSNKTGHWKVLDRRGE